MRSDLRYVVDGKVALIDDVVAFHLTFEPILVGVVRDGDHFSTSDLQLIFTSWLEVVVDMHLWLKAHIPRTCE